MKSVGLQRVALGTATLPRVAFTPKRGEINPPWWDVANILTEDGGFMLTEDGGAILLENEVKQIRLIPKGSGAIR